MNDLMYIRHKCEILSALFGLKDAVNEADADFEQAYTNEQGQPDERLSRARQKVMELTTTIDKIIRQSDYLFDVPGHIVLTPAVAKYYTQGYEQKDAQKEK